MELFNEFGSSRPRDDPFDLYPHEHPNRLESFAHASDGFSYFGESVVGDRRTLPHDDFSFDFDEVPTASSTSHSPFELSEEELHHVSANAPDSPTSLDSSYCASRSSTFNSSEELADLKAESAEDHVDDSPKEEAFFADSVHDDNDYAKLPASRNPVMAAMVHCALHKRGIEVLRATPGEVIFKVHDFLEYYNASRAVIAKSKPTEDLGARVKALRRWFVTFPKKKERHSGDSFLLQVKPAVAYKAYDLIERTTHPSSSGIRKHWRDA